MKKLTLLVVAALSTATTFAQTISGEVNNNTQGNAQISKSNHGSEVSASAQSSTTVATSADKSNHEMAIRENARKAKEAKNEKANKGKTEIEQAQPEPETTRPIEKREKKNRNQEENHGQTVADVATSVQTTALVEGKAYAENHGQAVSEIAHKTEINAKSSIDNNLNAANEMVQNRKDAAQDQGKEVKKVAKAKRPDKPEKVDVEAGTQVEGAGRINTAGRPQKIAGEGVARVKGGAARPVRVLKPSAAGGSGTIGGGAIGKGVGVGVGVGAKTKIKIGN